MRLFYRMTPSLTLVIVCAHSCRNRSHFLHSLFVQVDILM
uniref:Uncharacterized protein n=1 Tax=Anguilla anguilla TaxID=7936 RepID=A0A0E9S391_ANGAN